MALCDERAVVLDGRDWMAWLARARTINSLSGFKSANVIGTSDTQGVHNLSVVSRWCTSGLPLPKWGGVAPARGRRPHVQEHHGDRPVHVQPCGGGLVPASPPMQCTLPGQRVGIRGNGPDPSFPAQVGPDWKAPRWGSRGAHGLDPAERPRAPNACRHGDAGMADVPSNWFGAMGMDLEAAETVAISGLDGTTTQSWVLSYAKTDREVSVLGDPARGWEDVSLSCLLG